MGCLWLLLKIFFLIWIFRIIGDALFGRLKGGTGDGTGPRAKASVHRDSQSRETYLRLLMPLLAKLAKSDGHITEDEIRGVESIFRQLDLSVEEQRYAQQIFRESKDSFFAFEDAAHQFAQSFPDMEVRVLTLQFLMRVAAADGVLSPHEKRLLIRAAQIFRVPIQLFAHFFAQFSDDAGSSRERARPKPEHSRADDLALLGLTSSASAEDIKRAYRQKVKELHPDRLQAQGLPEAMLKQATERMSAINAAYDRLTK